MATDPELPAELLELTLDRFYAVAPEDRERVAAELVASHPAHGPAVRRLFARMAALERTLEHSFPEPVDEPETIGGMRVQRRLGEGAFGVVYLCEQTTPVVRRVAVKVLRPGAGDRDVLRRFRAEQQLLALLTHPAIAHVYDAGDLPDRRPYFVMEYIDGQPITVHCRERAAALEERLRLFVEAARGVEHAHQRGIVHRDLKPGNVLVCADTGNAQPKIIDFGIAKAMVGEAHDITSATATGRVLGTPGYMSPEQACGRPDAVDARADVFALGVMLCELLTDELPWPRGGHAPMAEPVLPSRRLATRAARTAPEQATALRRLAAGIRGDLDWIVGKAIRTDRAGRYATVGAMCDDINRFLRGEPVLAGPPSLRYRLRKLVQRRRTTASVLLAVGACALVGAVVLTWQHRGAATHAAAARQAVATLLRSAQQLTTATGPPNETMRATLARDALSFFERWLQEQPRDRALRQGRAAALVELSLVHWELGQHEAALRTAVIATDEIDAIADPDFDAAVRAQAWRHRGRALFAVGRNAEAVPWLELARTAVTPLHESAPAVHGLSLSAIERELATCRLDAGSTAAALADARRSVLVLEQLANDGARRAEVRADLVFARILLGKVLAASGQPAEAAAVLAAAERELDAVAASPWRATAMLRHEQACLAASGRDTGLRIAAFERARAACAQWCGHEPLQYRAHGLHTDALSGLATAYERATDWPRADATMQAAIAAAEQRVAVMLEPEPARRQLRWLRFQSVRNLWDRFRRQDLPLATEILRAIDPDDRGGAARPLAFELRAMHMLLADAAGTGDVAGWRAVGAAMPPFPSINVASAGNQFVEAWLGVCRAELAAGDRAAAAAALAHVEPALTDGRIDNDRRTRALHEKAVLAAADGDFDVSERILQQLLRMRPTWWSRTRVGRCRLEVARRLEARGEAAPAAARRTEAITILNQAVQPLMPEVERRPTDPFYVVPWGFAELDLATAELARGDAEAARSRLARVLPRLAAVRDTAHRDQWDEARFAAAEATLTGNRDSRTNR